MKYEDITKKIIGCAMTVHGALGNGFQEVIYQRAMIVEMQFQELSFEREKEMQIFYRDTQIGSLINFGAKNLQFKRVHNNKLIKKSFNQENQGSRQ